MSRIQDITKRINDFPMLSAVASRLLAISGDDRTALKDIVKIVEKDAFLASRILKISNSAAYSRGQQVATIGEAIVRLGEKTVVGVAMESSLSIYKQPLSGYESAAGDLWNHSLHTAICAREIARFAHPEVSFDLAYTSGLMHDIGKPVISDFMARDTKVMADQCDHHLVGDFAGAEKGILGIDHTEAGYELARHWRLPKPLCAVIRHHHKPSVADSEFRCLTYVVHIADILSMMEGVGTGADVLSYRMDEGYEQYLNLTKENLAEIVLSVQDEFAKTQKFIFGGEQT